MLNSELLPMEISLGVRGWHTQRYSGATPSSVLRGHSWLSETMETFKLHRTNMNSALEIMG